MGSLSATRVLVAIPVAVIRAYQRLISPMRPQTCRYFPSCSSYAVTALERFGPVRGSMMAGRRLARCHPFTAGGVDHVPLRDASTGLPLPGTTGPRDFAAGPDVLAPQTDQSPQTGTRPSHARSGRR